VPSPRSIRRALAAAVATLLLVTCSDGPPDTVSDAGPPATGPGRDSCELTGEETPPEPVILFGDLHAHTSTSLDGTLVTLPLFARRPYGPRDACRFARYCAQLDFWSVNDHAEEMLAHHWADNTEAVLGRDRP